MIVDLESFGRYARALLTEDKPPLHAATQWGMFTGIALASGLHRAGLALDPYLYPGCDRTKVREPLFIVGAAKSGINVLHRVLARDRGRFVTFRGWEVLLPSLVSRALAAEVPTLAARALAAGAPAQAEWMDELRQLYPVGLDEPEQDEFLLGWTFGSPALSLLFPYPHWTEDLHDFRRRPPRVQRALLDHYDACLRRQLYLRGGDHMILSANPTFVSKIPALHERYPDARFIHTVRDPRAEIGALVTILDKVWDWLGAPTGRREVAIDAVVRGTLRDHRDAAGLLAAVDPDRVVTVTYDDLATDAREVVHDIYRRFSWLLPRPYDAELKQLRGALTAGDGVPADALASRPRLAAWLDRETAPAQSSPPPAPRARRPQRENEIA